MVDFDTTRLLLSNLIKINSVNPSLESSAFGEKELARFIGNRLENLGLSVEYQFHEENRENLIARLRGSKEGRTLILNGHLDTVSVEGMNDPFSGKVKNGKLFGRGAFDMKGGIASMILAVEEIVTKKLNFSGEIILAFVTDEEYMSRGTELSLEGITADAAIVCEPTDERIVITHKGFIWLKITIEGIAAHGSMPEKGIDAIMKMGKVLVALDKLEKETWSEINNPLLGKPSLHASLISGGLGISTYPDNCELEVEIRTLPEQSMNSVKSEITSLLGNLSKQDKEIKAHVEFYFEREALNTPTDIPIVEVLAGIKKERGDQIEYAGVPYWTDAALLHEKNIPSILFGPKGDGAHAAVEYVEIESVREVAEVLSKTIVQYLSG